MIQLSFWSTLFTILQLIPITAGLIIAIAGIIKNSKKKGKR